MSSVLGVHWRDWCWSWNSNILATWCEELTHLNATELNWKGKINNHQREPRGPCIPGMFEVQHKGPIAGPSVQFSRSVMSDSLWPHESQHARPPCPSPTPGVHSDSHPSSPRCHPAISSSATRFSFCLQSIPASGSFPMSQLFASSSQSIGTSASILVLPINIWG